MNSRYQGFFYPESRFGGFTNVDGTVNFYARLRALIREDDTVLDIGCGRGVHQAEDPNPFRRRLRTIRGSCHRVIGIDVDQSAEGNGSIDEFRLIAGQAWPIEDGSIDVCYADCVLEHLADPQGFFSEIARVLKPGGFVGLRTTNRWSYVGLISSIVPNARHAGLVTRAQRHSVRGEADVFPVTYRCNTRRRIIKQFRRIGFEACVYGWDSEPTYLEFSFLSYVLGWLHQKLAPGGCGVALMAFAQKRADPER